MLFVSPLVAFRSPTADVFVAGRSSSRQHDGFLAYEQIDSRCSRSGLPGVDRAGLVTAHLIELALIELSGLVAAQVVLGDHHCADQGERTARDGKQAVCIRAPVERPQLRWR
jgi:hypothetical protein